MGALRFSGTAKFGELVAIPSRSKLRRAFDFGLQGAALLPSKAFSPFFCSYHFLGSVCWICSSALGLAIGVLGRECCCIVRVGAYAFPPVPPFPLPRSFLVRVFPIGDALSHLVTDFFRLYAVSVAAAASRFSGVLMRDTLSCTSRGKCWRLRVSCRASVAQRAPAASLFDFTSAAEGGGTLSGALRISGNDLGNGLIARPFLPRLRRGYELRLQ